MKAGFYALGGCALVASLLVLGGCSEDTTTPETSPGGGSANATMSIEPGVAVGPIRAGTTVEEVERIFGKPQLTTANALEYTKLGFAVMPRTGQVQAVLCGDVTGLNGPLVSRFNGKTKENIGLKSTREDLVKAYGDPTETRKFMGGTESLLYANLGMTFTLEGGKVYHMIVRLTGEKQPDRSVTIDLAPPAKK